MRAFLLAASSIPIMRRLLPVRMVYWLARDPRAIWAGGLLPAATLGFTTCLDGLLSCSAQSLQRLRSCRSRSGAAASTDWALANFGSRKLCEFRNPQVCDIARPVFLPADRREELGALRLGSVSSGRGRAVLPKDVIRHPRIPEELCRLDTVVRIQQLGVAGLVIVLPHLFARAAAPVPRNAKSHRDAAAALPRALGP